MENAAVFDLKSIASNFCIYGDFVSGNRYGSGHINDTFEVTCSQAGTKIRYIIQRINRSIFKDPAGMMDNIQRVTSHLAAKFKSQPDASRRTLTVVPARSGAPCFKDAEGDFWRCYFFIEEALTLQVITDTGQAEKAAAAYGAFQRLLTDLPGGRMLETIPNFHNALMRFEALEKAVAADTAGRAKLCRPEIEFSLQHRQLAASVSHLQAQGLLPERITHNDTKLNNILLDETSGEGICVIDLDTVMPGLALYDFGDMVRTMVSPAAEDEPDLSKVQLRLPFFEALTRGFLSTAGSMLTQAEKDHLPLGGQLITFVIAIRFLTDFLSGDVYFKVHKENHNLLRARTQLELTAQIGRKMDELNAAVKRLDAQLK